jgi:hypothetical protein
MSTLLLQLLGLVPQLFTAAEGVLTTAAPVVQGVSSVLGLFSQLFPAHASNLSNIASMLSKSEDASESFLKLLAASISGFSKTQNSEDVVKSAFAIAAKLLPDHAITINQIGVIVVQDAVLVKSIVDLIHEFGSPNAFAKAAPAVAVENPTEQHHTVLYDGGDH